MMASVVIPILNERENLPRLVKILRNLGEFHLIFVDDGSTDGGPEYLESLGLPNLRVIRRNSRDFGGAVGLGIAEAPDDEVVVIDADLQHSPESIPMLLRALSSADVVVGSRYCGGGRIEGWPWWREMISRVAVGMFRLLPGCNKTTDPMSGFFALKKSALRIPDLSGKGFKVLAEILVANPEARVKEVPITFRDRTRGKSKLGLGEALGILLQWLRLLFKGAGEK